MPICASHFLKSRQLKTRQMKTRDTTTSELISQYFVQTSFTSHHTSFSHLFFSRFPPSYGLLDSSTSSSFCSFHYFFPDFNIEHNRQSSERNPSFETLDNPTLFRFSEPRRNGSAYSPVSWPLHRLLQSRQSEMLWMKVTALGGHCGQWKFGAGTARHDAVPLLHRCTLHSSCMSAPEALAASAHGLRLTR